MNKDEMDELVFLWEEYGKATDEDLTRGAIDLKRKVLEFIASLPDLPKLFS